MNSVKSLLLLLVLGLPFGSCARGSTSGRGPHGRLSKDRHDALKLARCDVKCWNLQRPDKNECVKKCLQREKKPGECQSTEQLTFWDAACLSACKTDANCPGLLKCCHHRCGATCQHPKGLHQVPGLPSIPQKLLVSERPRGRTVRIQWSNSNESKLLYVIEERQHIGIHFSESKFEEWMPRKRTQKNNITLKHIKPGRWYQFRIAAVNENGTRGYSKPSAPFKISHGPRSPGLPQNLSVDTLYYYNGTFSGILRWKPPLVSDLPIHKYKVFWSRRLREVDEEKNSVLVNHQTVAKDKNYFELKGLQPKSLYFLQVQALSQFGTKRLKSDKAAVLLDTTKYSNDTIMYPEGNSSKRSTVQKIENLQLKKIVWKDSLNAKISWKPVSSSISKHIRYSVQWWTGPCEGDEKGYKTGKQMAITTDLSRLDLYNLHFECKYTIQVNKIPDVDKTSYKAYMTFTTPPCKQFRNRMKNANIKCV